MSASPSLVSSSPEEEHLGTRVYYYILAQFDLILDHLEFVHALWHQRMEPRPVSPEIKTSSAVLSGKYRPRWPSPRFVGFALLAVGFVPMMYLAKALMLFAILILVANLAKKFGDHQIGHTATTSVGVGERAAAEEMKVTDVGKPVGEQAPPTPLVAVEEAVEPKKEQHRNGQEKEEETALPTIPQAATTAAPAAAAAIPTGVASEFPSKVRAMQAQYQGQLPSCLPSIKPKLLVCTKCQFSLNQYLEGCESEVIDIEDVVQTVTDPTRTDSPHVKVQEEGGGEAAPAQTPEKQKRQKKLKKKLQKKLHGTESMTSGKVLYQNILTEIQDTPLEKLVNVEPVTCLATCYHSNCIAFSAVGRHTYQFGDLDHNDSSTVTDILKFAEQYITVPEGYTKTKQRPEKLKETLLARVPPLPLILQ